MKNYYIGLAMIAALVSFSSCQNEEDFGGTNAKDNEIVFSLRAGEGKMETRSASEITEPKRSIPFATENGTRFYLEESVTSLDVYSAPETRGTPAYTENIETLFGTFKAVAYEAGQGTGTKALEDAIFTPANPANKLHIWRYAYPDKDLFKGKTLQFFMNMPAAPKATMTIGYTNTSEKQTIDVTNYVSPATASEQEDILFATRKLNGTQGDANYYDPKNGADILFYHALTGVKFKIHADAVAEGIKVKKLTFSGIRTKGSFYVSSIMENGGYVDITGTHSSKDAVIWSEAAENEYGSVSQEFDGEVVSLNTTNMPSSYAQAKDNNLNDANATKTFWLVPQVMTDDVKLTVEYEIGEKKVTQEVDLGKALKDVEWFPGQLRTYTLTVSNVDIHIDDKVNGIEKTDVVITNTGNCDEYVRATIVAYWADERGNAISGFTAYNEVDGKKYGTTELTPWRLNATGTGSTVGTFEGLYDTNEWVYNATEGFYYHIDPISPDQTASTFFRKYSCQNVDVYSIQFVEQDDSGYKYVINDTPVKAHIVMDIVVQAIAKEGTETYSQAWERAKASKTPNN